MSEVIDLSKLPSGVEDLSVVGIHTSVGFFVALLVEDNEDHLVLTLPVNYDTTTRTMVASPVPQGLLSETPNTADTTIIYKSVIFMLTKTTLKSGNPFVTDYISFWSK